MAPAKRGTKREAVAAVPQAKKNKVDPAVESLRGAIAEAELPEACRKMLEASLPHIIAAPQAEWHALQHSVASMVGDAVAAVHARRQCAVDAENAKLGDVEGKRAELLAAVAAAEAARAEAAAVVEAKSEELVKAAEVEDAAQKQLDDRQQVQSTGDASLNEAKESQAQLENGIRSHLEVIVQGTSDDMAQHFESLMPMLTGSAVDASLMSALPSVCTKKTAERGAFDSMVLEQLGCSLRERAAELSRIVVEAAPAAQARQAAVQQAQEAVDEAAAVRQAAGDALAAARSAADVAEAHLAAAKDAAAAFEPEYSEACQARDKLLNDLTTFEQGALATIQRLQAKAAPQVEAPALDVAVGGA